MLTARTEIAAYSGLVKALVMVIRRRSRQIEILVNVKVAKVCKVSDKAQSAFEGF